MSGHYHQTTVAHSAAETSPWRVFAIVWAGQLVSIIGSGLTDFTLGLWVYQQTHSVTQFSLMLLFRVLPTLILSPFAGVLVDRWDKRRMMILSDASAALISLALAGLFFSGQLQIGHIYLAVALRAVCGVFQVPAYMVAITTLVPAKNLSRAAGLVQLAQASADILAPLLAGFLVAVIQIQGVLLVDVITFLFAVATLASVRFPDLPASSEKPASQRVLFEEALDGLRFIAARPGLVALLLFFAIINFQGGLIAALIQPLVLSFASAPDLGLILAVAGGGLLLGSLILSAWGGPARRMDGVLMFMLLFGFGILVIGLQPSVLLVAIGAAGAHFCWPFVNGCSQAIWQNKVPVTMQGRVFAVRQMFGQAAQPLAFLLAGPLADQLCGPLLAPGGALVGNIGQVIGVGPERGAALLFVIMGLISSLIAAMGYRWPPLRRVEDELPEAAHS